MATIRTNAVIVTYQCERPKCRYTWQPRRDEIPARCPKCGSGIWNRPPREKVEATDS